ncbi:hypothetical protein SDC9_209078 [bioreactor metagenome]|uniref:Uncharacterized protein n=1 Tax=bioreactor metagenome TaxID=1076179 RepID=A0A645JDT0_9ZZZZ
MIDALLQIWYLRLQSRYQTLGYFTQEHSRFAGRVKKSGVGITEQFLRQHIEHLVHDIRRREHLIVREIRQTRQHIGIVYRTKQIISHCPAPSCNQIYIVLRICPLHRAAAHQTR